MPWIKIKLLRDGNSRALFGYMAWIIKTTHPTTLLPHLICVLLSHKHKHQEGMERCVHQQFQTIITRLTCLPMNGFAILSHIYPCA